MPAYVTNRKEAFRLICEGQSGDGRDPFWKQCCDCVGGSSSPILTDDIEAVERQVVGKLEWVLRIATAQRGRMSRTSIIAAVWSVSLVALAFPGALAQTTSAGAVHQAFAVTTSAAATYATPSGAFQALPGSSLNLRLRLPSMLIVTFSARGTVQPPTTGSMVPIVFVKCEIDNAPCQPDANPVEFLYPQFCCDARSFTWVVHSAAKGAHTIQILWGMGNATSAVVSNRTLAIEAAQLERRSGER